MNKLNDPSGYMLNEEEGITDEGAFDNISNIKNTFNKTDIYNYYKNLDDIGGEFYIDNKFNLYRCIDEDQLLFFDIYQGKNKSFADTEFNTLISINKINNNHLNILFDILTSKFHLLFLENIVTPQQPAKNVELFKKLSKENYLLNKDNKEFNKINKSINNLYSEALNKIKRLQAKIERLQQINNRIAKRDRRYHIVSLECQVAYYRLKR